MIYGQWEEAYPSPYIEEMGLLDDPDGYGNDENYTQIEYVKEEVWDEF